MNKENFIEEVLVLPSYLIQRKAPSKRSAINEYQVGLLVRVSRKLAEAALIAYGLSDEADLPINEFQAFLELPEYLFFIDTCYATGFVCRDLSSNADLDQINRRPMEHISSWSLPRIRLYLHTLLRSERWAGGYSSPIFDALKSGALLGVVERLSNDDSLYAPD